MKNMEFRRGLASIAGLFGVEAESEVEKGLKDGNVGGAPALLLRVEA